MTDESRQQRVSPDMRRRITAIVEQIEDEHYQYTLDWQSVPSSHRPNVSVAHHKRRNRLIDELVELLPATPVPVARCVWTADDDGNYETACGQMFVLNDGTPAENMMAYCYHCGKPLTTFWPSIAEQEEAAFAPVPVAGREQYETLRARLNAAATTFRLPTWNGVSSSDEYLANLLMEAHAALASRPAEPREPEAFTAAYKAQTCPECGTGCMCSIGDRPSERCCVHGNAKHHARVPIDAVREALTEQTPDWCGEHGYQQHVRDSPACELAKEKARHGD